MTLVELIVAIGVIALLIAMLLPTLGGVARAGHAVNEMSAARQLMLGYQAYATDHRDAVLPGYRTGLRVHDDRGDTFGARSIVAARYPWRLVPYLDDTLEALFVNESREVLEALRQTDHQNYVYMVSATPSLGLNTTWVGGDEKELGFSQESRDRCSRFYVTRMAEVLRRARLLVFASARGVDPLRPDAGVFEGHFRLRSPRLGEDAGYRWAAESFAPGDPPGDFGQVSLRYDGEGTAAFVDGHVDLLDEAAFKDMRFWANRATRPDYGLRAR